MNKFFYGFLLIGLIISTTLVKNSTKNIDQKIFESKENIRVLRDRHELVLLDYNYLSSPEKLIEYQSLYFENELREIDITNINKISLDHNEIQIKKFISIENE